PEKVDTVETTEARPVQRGPRPDEPVVELPGPQHGVALARALAREGRIRKPPRAVVEPEAEGAAAARCGKPAIPRTEGERGDRQARRRPGVAARRRVDRGAGAAERIGVDLHPAGPTGGRGLLAARADRGRTLRPRGGTGRERSARPRRRREGDNRDSNGEDERQEREDRPGGECGRRT